MVPHICTLYSHFYHWAAVTEHILLIPVKNSCHNATAGKSYLACIDALFVTSYMRSFRLQTYVQCQILLVTVHIVETL